MCVCFCGCDDHMQTTAPYLRKACLIQCAVSFVDMSQGVTFNNSSFDELLTLFCALEGKTISWVSFSLPYNSFSYKPNNHESLPESMLQISCKSLRTSVLTSPRN